ncbi:MAG: hypothetical protein OXC63_02040 [Aestuariivita sp.]|nr:hypothetical protein [Aestuariivita sp.]MCY4346611.1 hypothetical protein [Aestuariivita sp.]
MRALNDRFLKDLKDGILAKVTETVQWDSTLCLELRGTSINVYYRGCNLMKIQETRTEYRGTFNPNYFKDGRTLKLPKSLTHLDDVGKWLEAWPSLKGAVDQYIAEKVKKDEREVQQMFVRANNYGRIQPGADLGIQYKGGSLAQSTDFYICDVEYVRSGEPWRFDMIAVHWPSDRHLRSKASDRRLVIIEVKCGDGALSGAAGLSKHIGDIDRFLENPDKVAALKNDMVQVFNQKRALGLMDCNRDLKGFSDERPIVMLALVSHDPDSTKLRECLAHLSETIHPHMDLRIGVASFFGFGLYDQGIHTVDEVLWRFGDFVYKDLPRNIGLS